MAKKWGLDQAADGEKIDSPLWWRRMESPLPLAVGGQGNLLPTHAGWRSWSGRPPAPITLKTRQKVCAFPFNLLMKTLLMQKDHLLYMQ